MNIKDLRFYFVWLLITMIIRNIFSKSKLLINIYQIFLQPTLYSNWRSSCSFRVRIVGLCFTALNLKKLHYNIHPVNVFKNENKSQEYLSINPLGKVPALQIDGHTIVESLNILHYLEETRPEHPLMPIDVYQRSKVREVCEMIQSGIQPLQNVGLLSHVESLAGKEERLKWAQYWINYGFSALEKQLTAYSGKCSVGDDITLADCCVVPQVFNAIIYRVDLEQYPTIFRIFKGLEKQPAFYTANPFNQSDCDMKEKKIDFKSKTLKMSVNRKQLSPEDPKFREVSKFFLNSARGKDFKLKIEAIEEVHNPSLQQNFEIYEKIYKRRYGKVQVINAFHGTHSNNIQSVLENNLQCNRSGLNSGERFGKGVNFSALSHVASHYCCGPDRVLQMLLCRVLVSNVQSVPELETVYAPYLKGSPVQCDTMARNAEVMDVVVKYEDHTFYPTFVIKFTKHSLHTPSFDDLPFKSPSASNFYPFQ
ncbi:putative maleylacetoacetate isomerase 2 [Frankliniella fusca]|uniref:Poly [ADP-ribose] polymerase n=1 Tax=Frankliniella fusca TaxID=407009 RepID=A0AAE1HWL4_9NEOP|nr:putative maleylacetoacetate isomerase 2 [Frankliniella fusca]